MTAHGSVLDKRPFSDSFLLSFSTEHLVYEIDMFFGAVRMLSQHSVTDTASPEDSIVLRNALIEVFVLHLRNLVDFLYLDSPRPTDVVAADFCLPDAWAKARPQITRTLDAARIRANKEVAHLTTQRIAGTPPEKEWQWQAIAMEIRQLLQLFVAEAETTRLSSGVAPTIS